MLKKIREKTVTPVVTKLFGNLMTAAASEKFRWRFLEHYERMAPRTEVHRNGKSFRFWTPNPLTDWRAATMFDKEPETIEWIDSFDVGDVLYDVGANVGMYTIYAAVSGKLSRVMAFEPESSNCYLLNRNIALNSADDVATAFCVAFGGEKAVDCLFLSSLESGQALHNVGSENTHHGVKEKALKQGITVYSLDEFIREFNPPFPNHVKIDVDGLEAAIIGGAEKTLTDPRLKTLLLEIDESHPNDVQLAEKVLGLGFKLRHKKHAPMFENSKYASIYNYVFEK